MAGIDIATERRVPARLGDAGAPIGKSVPITEDRAGCDTLLKELAAMEATGYYWKNLFVVLVTTGRDVAVLGAVRRNASLRACYERVRAGGKPPKLALIADMRQLLHAIHSVAKHRRPLKPTLEQARWA